MVRASTRRMLSIMISLLLLVGAVVVYGSFLKKEYALINESRGLLAAKTTLLENQTKIITRVQEVLRRYEGSIKLEETASLALPNQEEFPLLINQLYSIARATGLNLQSVELSTPSLKGSKARSTKTSDPSTPRISIVKIGTIQVTLQLTGNYAALKNFLQTIENNIRIMDVQSLNFASGDKAAYSYSVVINTYYQTKTK